MNNSHGRDNEAHRALRVLMTVLCRSAEDQFHQATVSFLRQRQQLPCEVLQGICDKVLLTAVQGQGQRGLARHAY